MKKPKPAISRYHLLQDQPQDSRIEAQFRVGIRLIERNRAHISYDWQEVSAFPAYARFNSVFKEALMVAIQFEYQGDLHCKAVHTPSGTELNTDAPKDNQGRGESFSPTDLVATALGTCILTIMGIMARTL